MDHLGGDRPPERIALLHGESRDDPNAFESVLTFEPAGDETRIVMRTVFPTEELRAEAVEKYHAIEGGEQTLRNLAAYVAELTWDETTEGSGGLMAGKVFFSVTMSLDGFMAPEEVPVKVVFSPEKPERPDGPALDDEMVGAAVVGVPAAVLPGEPQARRGR